MILTISPTLISRTPSDVFCTYSVILQTFRSCDCQETTAESEVAHINSAFHAFSKSANPSIQTPVLDRFREVGGLDVFCAFEVCDGSGHLQDPGVSPGA